jgi:hypothetical protein
LQKWPYGRNVNEADNTIMNLTSGIKMYYVYNKVKVRFLITLFNTLVKIAWNHPAE